MYLFIFLGGPPEFDQAHPPSEDLDARTVEPCQLVVEKLAVRS